MVEDHNFWSFVLKQIDIGKHKILKAFSPFMSEFSQKGDDLFFDKIVFVVLNKIECCFYEGAVGLDGCKDLGGDVKTEFEAEFIFVHFKVVCL